MSDVFISYAREDISSARTLAELIRNQRIEVWWDPDLRSGQDFAQVIEKVLAGVKCVVVLWSRHSVTSRWVRAEATEGWKANKLIPMAIDQSEPPLIFRGLHTSELSPGDLVKGSPKVEKLIADIKALIEGEPEEPASAKAKPQPPKEPDIASPRQVQQQPSPRKLFVAAGVGALVLLGLMLLGLPGLLLDYATGISCKAGFSGSPLVAEGFILAALLAIPAVLYTRLRPLRNARPRWLLLISAPCILGASIILQWSFRLALPQPDHLYGQVKAPDLTGIRVLAKDCMGRVISLGDAPVDTLSGDFGLRLKPMFADRPRTVLLSKAGCAEYSQEVPWPEWREKKVLGITFPCEGEQ